jgi:hypothetical protein
MDAKTKKKKKKLERGEVEVASNNDMVALKWQDKRKVHMLTTVHGNEMKSTHKTEQPTKKPECIEYSENMGVVDRLDMMLSSVECVQKSIK